MRFKLESLSSEKGWSLDKVCEKCGENESECLCNMSKDILEPSKHSLVFRLEKRNGKSVTVIYPFYIDEEQMREVLSKLKKSIGVGGAIKSNEIELQGDLKERAKTHLEKQGFRFKK